VAQIDAEQQRASEEARGLAARLAAVQAEHADVCEQITHADVAAATARKAKQMYLERCAIGGQTGRGSAEAEAWRTG
jgi:hypothetical protein